MDPELDAVAPLAKPFRTTAGLVGAIEPQPESYYRDLESEWGNPDFPESPYPSLAEQKLRDEADQKLRDEAVNHPAHYNNHPSGVECIEIVRHMTFNVGNVLKYLWRSGLKDGEPVLKDFKKALWYLEDEIKRLEGQK